MKKFLNILFLSILFFCVSTFKVNADSYAHNFYSDPDLSSTSEKFDTVSIDFKIHQDAKYTYWSLWNWNFDLTDFKTSNSYNDVTGGGAYAGVQNNINGNQAIMSIWQVEYTSNNESKILNAKNIYPGNEGTYDNEGSGVKKLVDYNWQVDNWYRMVIHTWYDNETKHTFAGEWIENLNDNQWTLITYYDTNLNDTYLTGKMSQFQENFSYETSEDIREIYLKNIYVKEVDNTKFKSINSTTLSYSYFLNDKKGRHEFGATNEYFYGLTGGTVSNQSDYDNNSLKSLYATITQPDTPDFGSLSLSSFTLADNVLNWSYSSTSTPQESVKISIKDLNTNQTKNIVINRPETTTYSITDSLPIYCNITLTSTDIFGNTTTKTIENDNRSKVNTLESLSLSEGTIDFSPSVNTYNVVVKNNVEKITIQSELTDSKSTYVEGYGNRDVNLEVGENEILVKVKSEYGTTNTYTINVIREEEPFLNSIKINGNILNGFQSNKYAYEIKLYTLSVNITTTQDEKFTVEGTGEKVLQLGQNTIELKVTNSVGDYQSYILNIITEEKEPYLTDLKVDNNTVKNFLKTTFVYEMELNKNLVDISATSNSTNHPITGDLGEKQLKYGENIYKINVSNEFGDKNEYILSINRPDDRSTDYTLKSITLSAGEIEFDSLVNTYEIHVDNSVDNITIDSTLNDAKANYVDGYGNRKINLKVGINEVLIKVQAENETINVYTLNIIRDDLKEDVTEENNIPKENTTDDSQTISVPNTLKNVSVFFIVLSICLIVSGGFILSKRNSKFLDNK